MYWQKELEVIPREELEALQWKRLQETLDRAGRSPYYGSSPGRPGLSAADLHSLKDVEKLPFTTKDDLREHWPYGFIAVSKDELVRMHSSSGTTGRATVIFHTVGDIAEWTNLVARSMFMTGMRKGDVFQNMMTYGLFTGGLGFHYGAEKLGALVIPAHIDRPSSSVLANLGFLPDLPYTALEMLRPTEQKWTVITASDAHSLGEVGTRSCTIELDEVSWEALKRGLSDQRNVRF